MSMEVFTRAYRLLFFFFQAEDGIRYLTVTGVQTCALPISPQAVFQRADRATLRQVRAHLPVREFGRAPQGRDRKSTRLNSSHSQISYAVFCLKKKKHFHATSCTPRNVAQHRLAFR